MEGDDLFERRRLHRGSRCPVCDCSTTSPSESPTTLESFVQVGDPLTASNGEEGDKFGFSVDVYEESGESVLAPSSRFLQETEPRDNFKKWWIIGAPGGPASSGRGAAYIRENDPENTNNEVQLTARDGLAGDEFGHDVAIKGRFIVITAKNHNDRRGAAYVHRRNRKGKWTTRGNKLVDRAGGAGDEFGTSVDINKQGQAVITTVKDRCPRMYERNKKGNKWRQVTATCSNSQGRNLQVEGNLTSTSSAVYEDIAIVGAWNEDDGSVYTFVREVDDEGDGFWVERAQLIPDIPGASFEGFGVSVGIFNNTAIVGSPLEDGESGAVYVFREAEGNTWEQQARLVASGASPGDQFGLSVDIYDDTVIAGASEAAYIFTTDEDENEWTEDSKLTNTDSDNFGENVAIYGDNIIVGAYGTAEGMGDATTFQDPSTAADPSASFPTYSPTNTPGPTTEFPTLTPTIAKSSSRKAVSQ